MEKREDTVLKRTTQTLKKQEWNAPQLNKLDSNNEEGFKEYDE